MNDITIDRSDEQKQIRLQELRAELDSLGYHVVRKDWVRKFGVQRTISNEDWYRVPDEMRQRMERHTQRSMGADLGVHILESGAMHSGIEIVKDIGRMYRSTTSILLRDPQYDKPAWLT